MKRLVFFIIMIIISGFASADLSDFPDNFLDDGAFDGLIVVGEKATALDVVSQSTIALKIGSIISLLIILIIGLVIYLKHDSKSTIVYSTEKQVFENKIGSKTGTPFEKSEKEVLNKINTVKQFHISQFDTKLP